MSNFSFSTRDTRTEAFISGVRVGDLSTLKDGDEVAVRFTTGEAGGSPLHVYYVPSAVVERRDDRIRFVVKTDVARWDRKLYMGDDL